MSVRVGVLGAGFIGRIHALDLRLDARVQIVGIADIVKSAREKLAAELDVPSLPSFDALLNAGIDAVYVATPNTQHVEPVLRALRARVHVFSEKPMATSLQDAWTIRQAAQQAKVVYQIGFNRRFANVYQFAKSTIDTGRIRPLVAQLKHNRGDLKQPPWTGDPTHTGGYLYETPVHLFDMARYLFGEVQEISGYARQSVYQELDGFTTLLRFTSGLIGTLTSVAHTSWLFPYERVEIYGDHQSVVTEELERAQYSPQIRGQVEAIDCFHMPMEQKWGYLAEDRSFIDAILVGGPPAVTAEDGYRATELVEACYRTVRTKRPVSLPLEEPLPE